MTEAKDLKRTTVKCHGMFDPKLAINGSKNEVTTDEEKDSTKEAKGQLSLLKENKA